MANKKKPQLSSALQGKFKLAVGLEPGKYFVNRKEVDFTTMTEAEAEILAKNKNFKWLEKIEPKEAKTPETKK